MFASSSQRIADKKGRRYLVLALGLMLGITIVPTPSAGIRTYFFDAYLNIHTRTPTDNPVRISGVLEWDGGACYGGPLYPLSLEVTGSDGFYGWAEAYWTQTLLYQSFDDSSVPSDPDNIDYNIYAYYFDCSSFSWHDDETRRFLPAEAPYPSHVIQINASQSDPCPGACASYQTDYTFRLMSQWPGFGVPNEHIDEDSTVTANPCQDTFTEGDFSTNGAGDFIDYVGYCCFGPATHPCCQGGSCQMEIDQVWSVGSTHAVAERTLYLECTTHWIYWWW